MAWPMRVWFTNSMSAAMMAADTRMVAMLSPVMISLPPARCSAGMDTTDLKDFGSDPQISSARFCKR